MRLRFAAVSIFIVLVLIIPPMTQMHPTTVEAQGLSLHVSAAERPEFENHFFGAQIIQIIINDPGATDPDESTSGLVVKGFNTERVHLSDGLWYSFFAEDEAFLTLIDVLSDGIRNNVIVVSEGTAASAGATLDYTSVSVGTAIFTITNTGGADSFIREISSTAAGPAIAAGDLKFVEVDQTDFFTILPQPFFEPAPTINPNLRLADAGDTTDPDGAGPADVPDGICETGDFNVAGSDCDWPYIQLFSIEELDQVSIRAGLESVVLVFDDFADSISARIDRVTDYPLNAEVIAGFTDFMWNINPVEEDVVRFALNRATGNVEAIVYEPIRNFDPDGAGGTGENIVDIFPVLTSSAGLEFDERQILELDSEGVQVMRFINWLDRAPFNTGTLAVGTFAASPFTFISDNARLVNQFDDPDNNGNGAENDAFIGAATANAEDEDLPLVTFIESDPNSSLFETIDEQQGGRSFVFAGINDRVASWDYFDVINSSLIKTHDGFTSVDREIYDSGDRAVFTVTDSDQNLRSRISEEPTGRESQSFIKVGNPFPLVNTRAAANQISNTSIDTITRLWGATFLQAGAGVGAPDATTFGIDGGAGANIFADVDGDAIIDMGTGAGEGTERFHSDGTDPDGAGPLTADIVEITNMPDTNRQLVLGFTPPLVSGSPATAIIVDTALTIDSINDFLDVQDITGAELLGQVRVDNLFDATADQFENFLVQVARIEKRTTSTAAPVGAVLGQTTNEGIVAADSYNVRMPKYNLVNVDLTDLQTTFTFAKAVVKIDAIDPACISNVVATAFAQTCVHASQVVDFQIAEAAPGVDTDGLATTGDITNDPVPAAGGVAGGLDSWDALIAASLDGTNLQTGFDRDALTSRIGVGAFRPVDLESVATANGGTVNDRIRVTLLLLAGADAAPTFAIDEPIETISAVSQRVVIDIGGLGTVFDPAPTDAALDNIQSPIGHAFSNLVYRLELDEEGSNASAFTGRADFFTFLQHDTVSDILGEITLTGDPLKIWLPNRFIPPNRLAFTYLDENMIQFFREVSATFIYETLDAKIFWDSKSYKPQARAVLTLEDEDLNRRPDAVERYTLPLAGFIFVELGKNRVDDTCAKGVTACFLSHVDASLRETGPDTGVFQAQVDMPPRLRLANGTIVNTNMDDIEITYIDVRDRSSVRQEFDDTTNVRTAPGKVMLDRNVYPQGPGIPPSESLLGAIMYISIQKGFFAQDPELRDVFDLTRTVDFSEETGRANDIRDTFEIRIFNGGGNNPIVYSANPASSVKNGGTAFPLLDRNRNEVTRALESGPNTNLYELEFMIYCPDAIPELRPFLTTPVCTNTILNTPSFKANSPIQITFNDPQDDSGTPEAIDAFAVIQATTASFGSDKPAYHLGEQIILWIVEPDRNLDSKTIEFIPFSEFFVTTDKVDAQPLDILIFVLNLLGEFITTYTGFVETEPNSGIFAILSPEGVTDEVVITRGEEAEIEFFDGTPSGGGNRIRVEYEVQILEVLPEIIFDKEEYTPFDEVKVRIISPDSNSEPPEIDIIKVLVSSSSQGGFFLNMPETGLNTGIFEEDFDLTPNRDQFLGELVAQREDGVSVEFRIDEDTVVTKSVFVNYHVGHVMFDRNAYGTTDKAILSVIDPDENKNPDTIDTLDARIWSTSDRGGLLVTLRETGDRTGIFEEFITFTTDEESTGTRLRVLDGDIVTAKYTDRTMPAPAALDSNGIFTVEVEELFASSLISTISQPLERTLVSEPILVDQNGLPIKQVEVEQQMLIQLEITNNQNIRQKFAYIVQVKDSDGVTISLSWVSGELPAKDAIIAAQSWIPEEAGRYEIEAFVWENIDNPVALSPIRTLNVTVS
jgi:hypothetical protein